LIDCDYIGVGIETTFMVVNLIAYKGGFIMFRMFRIMCSVILFVVLCTLAATPANAEAERKRPREYGIKIGVMVPGENNAITDVPGVLVGHVSLYNPEARPGLNVGICTGVTAVVPYAGNIFQNKVPAAYFQGNGFGKMAGFTQIAELGNIETPVVLTNTLSIADGLNGIIDFTLESNSSAASVNGIVGETNDSGLNDIVGRHVTKEHVVQAIKEAKGGPVKEGVVGAGMGTSAFGFKGGIGTASRILPESLGGWTVGVLVQTNFGGVLEINGAPVGVELSNMINPATGNPWPAYPNKDAVEQQWAQQVQDVDGSCMIIVATNAPLDFRNLERLSKRAFAGLGKTGSVYSNGSGDYIIAFSTASWIRMPHSVPSIASTNGCISADVVHNDAMSPLFQAVIEATEEAIINSLFMATDTTSGTATRYALPIDQTLEILEKYGRFNSQDGDGDNDKDKDKEIFSGCNAMNTGIFLAAFILLLALILCVTRTKSIVTED
jgi:D-aminopeptidase